MAKHDELLGQGPRQAPEPETAEQRSRRLGIGTAAGGVVAAGAFAAKFGALTKVFFWIFAFHGAFNIWRVGGWIAIGVALSVFVVAVVLRARSES